MHTRRRRGRRRPPFGEGGEALRVRPQYFTARNQNGKGIKLPNLPPPHHGTTFQRRFPALQLYGGSAYWCLSRECTEYVYRFLQEQRSYARFFKYVDVPEEIFFHTILLNSQFSQRVVNDDLRFLEWRDPAVAGGPAVLGKEDLGRIINSSKLFARKFDVTQDAEILDMIDARTRDD